MDYFPADLASLPCKSGCSLEEEVVHWQAKAALKSLQPGGSEPSGGEDQPAAVQAAIRTEDTVTSARELQRLRGLLLQRDCEINVLLKILKQEKRRAAMAEAGLEFNRPLSPILGDTSPLQLPDGSSIGSSIVGSGPAATLLSPTSSSASSREGCFDGRSDPGLSASAREIREQSHGDSVIVRAAHKSDIAQARQEAFDSFRKKDADTSNISQHKKILKIKYAEAKSLGEKVNTSRVVINRLKYQLQQQRIAREVQGLTGGSVADDCDSKDLKLRGELESEKSNFKALYAQLRDLKSEIEHVQHLLEKAKVQVQKDFEQWWTQQATIGKVHPSAIQPAPPAVWCTPSTYSSGSIPHPDPRPPVLPRPTSSSVLSRRSRGRHTRVMAAHLSREITSDSNPGEIVEKHKVRTEFDTVQERSSTHPADSQLLFNTPGSWKGSIKARLVSSYSEDPGVSHCSADSLQSSSGMHIYAHSLTDTARISAVAKSFTQPQALFGGTINPTPQHRQKQASIPLTGDSKADADIMAFYKAREKLIQRGQAQ